MDALNNFMNTHKKYHGAVEMNCLGKHRNIVFVFRFTLVLSPTAVGSRLHKYWFKADMDGCDCGGVVMTAVSEH